MTETDILSVREQIQEDIDAICDEFFYDTRRVWGDEYDEEKNELVKILCDAVCSNFNNLLNK